jgi:hypothetical protein
VLGDIVIDPLCTDPAVAVEAICNGRNAAAVIGDDIDPRELAQQLRAARRRGATGNAVLLRGDARELPRLLAQHAGGFLRRGGNRGVVVHPAGSVDLIVVSLPAPPVPGHRTRQGQKQLSAADVLTASAAVLCPGGYLVAVTDQDGHADVTRDLGSETVALGSELGLAYWQHVVALLVPIESGRLQPRSRRPARDAKPGLPHVVHQDVHVFRKPAAASAGAQQRSEADEAWWAA